MPRDYWQRRNDALDLETGYPQIYRHLALHEFPWDITQSLGLALFRTYAVPSIGELLDHTGEFTERTQKRYDDTVLLLDAATEHGFDHPQARTAIRRINAMHRDHGIGQDDLRYVLSTFVVVPLRWLERYGWRPLTAHEQAAWVAYYQRLGALMAITQIPADRAAFEQLMDSYEAEHFAPTEGGRRVADATLALLATAYPKPAFRGVHLFSRALMDPPLLAAFGYRDPGRAARLLASAGLRARAFLLRRRGPRMAPLRGIDLPLVRSYPQGYDVAALGSFPDHAAAAPRECGRL